MGLCPFHGEKSPSFTVSPSKQFFHCFGCGKNGNAIGFLMEHAGMGFVEAVQELANQCGLQVPQDDISPAERQRQAQQKQKAETLSDLLEKAGESYRKQLKAAPKAIEYLKKRGVSGEVSKRFGLGYAPAGWHGLTSVFAEYDNPQLEECGLVIVGEDDSRRYDRFRDRLMFPIRNVKGECIGFGGRVFGDEKPKYLNSPETPVFHKGRELYGLYEARQALRDMGYALVTEGYMDVVALAQLGFANAVPRWERPARRSMFKSCFASPMPWSSASTVTVRADAPPARHWMRPCRWRPTRAPSNSCSCLRSTTPTASSANSAPRPSRAMWAMPRR